MEGMQLVRHYGDTTMSLTGKNVFIQKKYTIPAWGEVILSLLLKKLFLLNIGNYLLFLPGLMMRMNKSISWLISLKMIK